MNLLLRDMPLFVEVARQKSFTRAAEALEMPLSTVSRRIIALEKSLGLPLFLRSPRKVELTETGKKFFERCSYIVSEAEVAFDELAADIRSPSGRLRVSIFTSLYYTYMDGLFSSFIKKWPEISLSVHLSERWVDLLSEPFDLDIRVGELPDSSLKVRRLVSLKANLYASPDLLARYPEPAAPSGLADFPCIGFGAQDGRWTMKNSLGRIESVPIKISHQVNGMGVALELVLAGLGATWIPPHTASRYEVSGALVNILPDWHPPRIDISLVMPSRQVPHRVRLFIDHLVEFFAKTPASTGEGAFY